MSRPFPSHERKRVARIKTDILLLYHKGQGMNLSLRPYLLSLPRVQPPPTRHLKMIVVYSLKQNQCKLFHSLQMTINNLETFSLRCQHEFERKQYIFYG